MSKRGYSSPNNGTASKGQRLVDREMRRAVKAERKIIRQAEHQARRSAGIRGADIEALPSEYQGLARTLTHGDCNAAL